MFKKTNYLLLFVTLVLLASKSQVLANESNEEDEFFDANDFLIDEEICRESINKEACDSCCLSSDYERFSWNLQVNQCVCHTGGEDSICKEAKELSNCKVCCKENGWFKGLITSKQECACQ